MSLSLDGVALLDSIEEEKDVKRIRVSMAQVDAAIARLKASRTGKRLPRPAPAARAEPGPPKPPRRAFEEARRRGLLSAKVTKAEGALGFRYGRHEFWRHESSDSELSLALAWLLEVAESQRVESTGIEAMRRRQAKWLRREAKLTVRLRDLESITRQVRDELDRHQKNRP